MCKHLSFGEDTMELIVKDYLPTEENVKLLGRTTYVKNALWLVLSGTGAEFAFTGTKAVVTMAGDHLATYGTPDTWARFAIFVNEECVIDDVMDSQEKKYTVFESEGVSNCTVRIIKLSEAANSTVAIKGIEVASVDGIKPTPAKEHLIEFVGDSITCGYGVEDEDREHPFSTKTENVMKTCAYKTAVALDADYSMVAYSGHGIVSGYTETYYRVDQLVRPYYSKVGFSYGQYMGEKATEYRWDFAKREPDLIVINLGTNDENYVRAEEELRKEEFVAGYVDFLYEIRQKNPNAVILCTLGIMTDWLYPCVERAAEKFREETGDQKMYAMKFDVQLEEDGYAAGWHPSNKTYTKAAEKLIKEIKKIMGW